VIILIFRFLVFVIVFLFHGILFDILMCYDYINFWVILGVSIYVHHFNIVQEKYTGLKINM
jgi:hypothetical protein